MRDLSPSVMLKLRKWIKEVGSFMEKGRYLNCGGTYYSGLKGAAKQKYSYLKGTDGYVIRTFDLQTGKTTEKAYSANPRRKAKRTRRNPRYARCGTLEGHNATINIRIPKNKDTKEFLTAFLNSWAEKLNRRIYFHLFEMDYGYSIDFTFSPRFESGSSLQNAKRFATEASRQLQQTFGNVVEAFVSEWREG